MPAAVNVDPRPLFLLPFVEVAKCSLHEEFERPAGDAATQGDVSSKTRFAECQLQRTLHLPLENGADVSASCRIFTVRKGDYVLLRPRENSQRPSIGEVLHFWRGRKDAKAVAEYVRVRWCYRAEDLGESPRETFGEDELFETEHFDDVEVDVIAGRCAVTSYNEWLSVMLRAKEEDSEVVQNRKMAVDEGAVPDGADNGESDGDDMSDTQSTFCDNYTSAAVRYYCRKFYDPISHALVASKLEDPEANPADMLGYRKRRADFPDRADSDGSASLGSESDFTDDDEESESAWGRVARRRTGSKRKRTMFRKGRRTTRGDGAKPQRASQFALPSDIGALETLPCRDMEKQHVRKFIEDSIRESAAGIHGGSRCLYICGVPGTGKTATVREIIRDLSRERAAGEIPPFEALEINAMSLSDPNLVYCELYKAITGSEEYSALHAAQMLEKRFADASVAAGRSAAARVDRPSAREKGKCVLLILDEMDVLVSRKQKILYDVLEWPTRKNARMAVIGISNTLDLPERMLPRLGSRLGVNRVTYPPYTSDQLKIILKLKLEDMKDLAYNESAVNLCATKVGAVSGDVRRALEILRRAGEAATAEGKKGQKGKKEVKAAHVHTAIQDISGRSRLATLAQLSDFEKLFLVSAVVLARNLGSFAVDVTSSISAVTTRAITSARRNAKLFGDDDIPSVRELEEVCFRLAGQRIVLLDKAAVFKNSRIIVNVSADDCAFALRDCDLSKKLLGEK